MNRADGFIVLEAAIIRGVSFALCETSTVRGINGIISGAESLFRRNLPNFIHFLPRAVRC